VQRYLTGKSIAQSRLSLIFNAAAKIPMQFFILFIGAIVFVFFVFERPPLLFNPVSLHQIQTSNTAAVTDIDNRFNGAFDKRKSAAMDYLDAKRANDLAREQTSLDQYRAAQTELRTVHHEAEQLAGKNDTNYIFLSFVTRYLPMGIVGLVIAVIFSAAMSSTSGEINSLSTVTVIDIYRRHIRKNAPDHHYLIASRVATAFWGIYAVVFAQFGGGFGALIEVVNVVGSLFYGGMLGVFILAFLFKKVGATAAFYGVIAGEAVIFFLYFFTKLAFLWFNVIGPFVVVGVALAITALRRPEPIRTRL
jgi:Na+/proline symporter